MERLQSMKTHFLMMMIGASMITMVCIGVIFLKTVLDETESKVEEFKAQLVADVERELKIQTETAISTIEQIYKRQQAGLLTEEQAKTEAAALVRDMSHFSAEKKLKANPESIRKIRQVNFLLKK